MATVTCSLHQTEVRELHAGLQAVSSKHSVTSTCTASSVFLLAKVPHGASILDFAFYCADGAANQEWDIGIQKPEGSTSGSVTVSTSALAQDWSNTGGGILRRQANLKLPYKVSISDEATPRWAWIIATNAVALSESAIMTFSAIYQMDADQA